jgi:hypothetical protein
VGADNKTGAPLDLWKKEHHFNLRRQKKDTSTRGGEIADKKETSTKNF